MMEEQYIHKLLSEEYTKNDRVHEVRPKVSISLLAYNHERFVAEAIESLLIQEVNFAYEIVVGEDCSLDSTREIVLNYQRKYPDKIRLFLSKEPLNNRKSGRLNFVRNLKACRGEYVALLDGDDYWTSPHKLQMQVDFLDSHPQCVLCFHPVVRIYEEGNKGQEIAYPPGRKKFYTLTDLLEKNFIMTSSAVFRNKLFHTFPDWYFHIAMGDWPLHLLNAEHGVIGYLDEIMSVYRIHPGGRWTFRELTRTYLDHIQSYKFYDNHFDGKYHRLIKSQISRCYYGLALQYRRQKQTRAALFSFLKCVQASPASPHVSYRELLSDMIKCASPRLFDLLSSCRRRLSGDAGRLCSSRTKSGEAREL